MKLLSLNVFIVISMIIAGIPAAQAEPPVKVDTASWLIMEGVRAYYKVFAHWPDSWSDVVDCGFVQTPLIAISGSEIDPDDGTFDFEWDIQYLPASDGSTPKLATATMLGGMDVRYDPINPVLSYHEKYTEDERPEIQEALSDPLRLTQWAIGGMLQHSLLLYMTVYGSAPVSFEEYISAGVTGIDCCSINPLTKGSFAGDGSANDFEFTVIFDEETGEPRANVIRAVDKNGETPWKFSY